MKNNIWLKIYNLYRINADGWHMFFSRFHRYGEFGNNYQEICRDIIQKCWNGRFFQTSTKGFSEFWVRDFAYCAESLVNLGYAKEVKKSLEYAMAQFQKYGAIKTKVSRNGLPVDIFHIAPDSLALLIRTFISTNNEKLANKYKKFLNNEILRYYSVIVDHTTGLVKPGYFSSVKDHSIRDSSTYDNAMVAYLGENLDKLNLKNPFKKLDNSKTLKKTFWTGSYFRDNIKSDEITGDANIFPYWLGLFNDQKMITKSFESMESIGLTDPYPLKYSAFRRGPFVKLVNFFTPNYQGDTIWAQNGLIFLGLTAQTNKRKFTKYFNIYKSLIEKHRNFIELFHSNGTTYRTFFYKADEGMLWCSMFLDIARRYDKDYAKSS